MILPHASVWPVLLVVLPLALAPAAYLAGSRIRAVLVWIAPIAMSLIVACLARQVIRGGPSRYEIGGWAVPLGIGWRVDGLTVGMLAISVLVVSVVCVHTAGSSHGPGGAADRRTSHFFWPLTYWLWASLNALFLSADIFNVYVTLEMLTLCSVGLIVVAGTTESVAAALRYLLLGLMGSLFYLLGVAFLYGTHGLLDMDLLAKTVRGGLSSGTALTLMVVGLLVKTALFPFHFWLPPAHASAPAPVSAMLSALVVKASFYVILRLWFEVFPDATHPFAAQLLGLLGTCAVLWGSIQALRADRLKLLVAYSTVAQLGYLFLVFPLASASATAKMAWLGGLLLVMSHALAKAAMFLAAGRIREIGGDDRLDQLAGIGQRAPMALTATALAGVSLMGLPPSGGFAGKWMLLIAGLESGQWWWSLVLILGGLLTAGYLFRFWRVALTGTGRASRRFLAGWRTATPALVLAIMAVLLAFLSTSLLEVLKIGVPLAGGLVTEVSE